MPVTVIERGAGAVPRHVDFVNAYGLTETSSTIAVLGPDDHRAALASDDPAVRRPARLGRRPLPGVEVEIRDDAARLPAGERARSGCAASRCRASTWAAARASTPTAGSRPATAGWLDADGYLFIEGRADDTIIRGGENIAPAEIEDVLLRHPAVLDVRRRGGARRASGASASAAVVVRARRARR